MPRINKDKASAQDLPSVKESSAQRSKVGRGLSFEAGESMLSPKADKADSSGQKKGGAFGALKRGVKDAGKALGGALGLGKGKGKGGDFGLADPARVRIIESALAETDSVVGMAANIAKRAGLVRNEMIAQSTDGYDALKAYGPALIKLGEVSGSLGRLNTAESAARAAFDEYRATGDETAVVQALKTLERIAVEVRIGICGLAGPGDSVSTDGFLVEILKPVHNGIQVGPKDSKSGKFDDKGKADDVPNGSAQLPRTAAIPSSQGIVNYGRAYMEYVDVFRATLGQLGG